MEQAIHSVLDAHRISSALQSEKIGYKSRQRELFDPHGVMATVSVSAPCLELLSLMVPLDALWFSEGHEYYAWDLDEKCLRRAAFIMPILVRWQKVVIIKATARNVTLLLFRYF